MKVEQKQFDITILKGFSTIEQLLKDVDNEIIQNGYGKGWYLRKLEMKDWRVYAIIVERIIQ